MYRVIALGIGYLLGGIQTAVLYSRLKGMDIRNHGSGNAGATNTLRVLGKKAGLVVFLGDVLKAAIAVLLMMFLFKQDQFVAGLYAGIGTILGHSYPMFFKFKGGKGIAVTVGTIFMLDVRIGVIAGIAFIVCAFVTRIVSVSSMLLTACIPVGILLFYRDAPFFVEALILGLIVAGFTAYRHKENIKRLMNGTESKLGSKK